MPSMSFSRSIAAGATDTPLQAAAWAYERAPFRAVVSVWQRTTATGVLQSIVTGSQLVQEASPIQSGGTAGVTPSNLNTQATSFIAAPGDQIKIENRNTTAGALTVDTLVVINPI